MGVYQSRNIKGTYVTKVLTRVTNNMLGTWS